MLALKASKLHRLEQDHLEIDPKFASDGPQSTQNQGHSRCRKNSTLGPIFWCLLTPMARNFDRFFESTGLPTRGCWHLQGQKGAFHRQPRRNLAGSEISGHFSGRASPLSWLEIPLRLTGKAAFWALKVPQPPWFGSWRPVKWPETSPLELSSKSLQKTADLDTVLLLC